MEKLTSLILAALCAAGVVSGPSADGVQADAGKQAELAGVQTAAYSVIDENTSAEREAEILAARNQVIFGDRAWTVDGAVRVFNLETGVSEKLPEFYDLFPADWEIPAGSTLEDTTYLGDSMFMTEIVSPATSNVSFDGNINIPLASGSDYNTPSFFSFNYPGKDNGPVGVYVASFPGTHYNAGFLNKDTDRGAGWVPGLEVGKSGCALVDYSLYTRYGAIVSVDSGSAMGRVKVDYVSNLGDVTWEDAV